MRFLLLTIIIGYIIIKAINFFFRIVLGGSTVNQYGNQQQHRQQRPSNGNVNVDYVPKDDKKSKENFKGGEYVDFEEVK